MQDTTAYTHTNRLIHETSPYLLQHAHNPVDWFPWGQDAFDSARVQNKLVLVSIGYSSCHWCHVMENESFENDSIAALMNDRFICVKVDREERPDVDQVYMTAVQLLTGRGGWPLNCFVMPDGRPVYGGTYFPPEQWRQLLEDLSTTWQQEPDRVKAYADQLQQGVAEADLVKLNTDAAPCSRQELDQLVDKWSDDFDHDHGGPDRAPKFPMPNNLQFLLRYGTLTGDEMVLKHVRLTLDKMAMGGIFDQVGGGFARYSTDVLWKVPHFEKMLYDNAQLVSLYSQGYQAFQDPLYAEVVRRTLDFIRREMLGKDGGLYSALDADSEGEEGRYYVWTRDELLQTLGEADMRIAETWYDLHAGAWEDEKIILVRTRSTAEVAGALDLSEADLLSAMDRINGRLLEKRAQRERPGLDDKALTSWNALMVTGFADAYDALGDPGDLALARQAMERILSQCRRADGGLWHSSKTGQATINGYLEDYSFTIEALTNLYQVTFEEHWIEAARQLMAYAIAHFMDPESRMFHFTSDLDPPLIARKMEVTDNVIPSSNSAMARDLFLLGHLFDQHEWTAMSDQMLANVRSRMAEYPQGYGNWAQLALSDVFPFHEIAITGPDHLALRKEFGRHYIPERLFLGAGSSSDLPLLEGKFLGTNTIFVCENKVCQLPVNSVAEALKQLR
ncbi:MAG: thioredoxin domain-containing protein [Flavobacteriales bacterium]|nr:thioredoxin domain-containing protein [Flavobacteriales bacterium]MCB9193397.1 thioredoxin domain-containing protein [Flavobacteriales bacterium]